MSITKLKYTSMSQDSIQVTSEDGGYYTAPWPCHTWHAQAIQEAIDSGMIIESWKTDIELALESKQVRISEIDTRLLEIDSLSIRPLRAIQSGTATQFDTDKLAALDEEAATLRAEKKTLIA